MDHDDQLIIVRNRGINLTVRKMVIDLKLVQLSVVPTSTMIISAHKSLLYSYCWLSYLCLYAKMEGIFNDTMLELFS